MAPPPPPPPSAHPQQLPQTQEPPPANHPPQPHMYLLDDLFCEEKHLEEEEEEEEEVVESEEDSYYNQKNNGTTSSSSSSATLLPLLLLEQDLFWEDEELFSLFSKEQEAHEKINNLETDSNLLLARKVAVEWMLRVNAHYAFSPLTAVLSVNYLDRFITSLCFQKDKPWMTQLTAVACLSLAAKVEETQVPLLLDLQVEEAKYVFEAKTIQRMELLVLSTLHWKMNPVTPLSFLDHIIRRLGLKTNLHWEFMRMSERLLLSVIADSRSVCYPPSVLATATMLHVINQVEVYNPIDYQNQLLGILKINKDKVDECYQFILESMKMGINENGNQSRKRKYESTPSSPSGVIDASFSCDSSNDSWAVGSSLFKRRRNRAEEQQMRLTSFNSMAAVVDVLITSPR